MNSKRKKTLCLALSSGCIDLAADCVKIVYMFPHSSDLCLSGRLSVTEMLIFSLTTLTQIHLILYHNCCDLPSELP